jgi:ParB-like nuclease domain
VTERWPADRVERRPVAQLIPAARNARTHSEEQVAQIAASIKEWGWTVPVLVDEAGSIITGHGRVLAAQTLGLDTVPVMIAAGWSKAKKQAYAIADNKLPLNAEWDLDLLKLELGELKDSDFDLGLVGFSDDEIGALLASGAWLTDPDDAPGAPVAPVSKLGDVWLLGKHRLVCGDCTDALTVEKALNGIKPHLMVTDPPYGVGFERGKFVGKSKAAKGTKFTPIENDGKRGPQLTELISSALEAWGIESGTVYCWSAPLEA